MWCADISCNKKKEKVIGEIPIKMCEERAESRPTKNEKAKRGGGGGGRESLMEKLEEEEAQGGEVEVYSPPG